MANLKKTISGKFKKALIHFLARRLPDCRTLTPTLSQSLDRPLSLRERTVLKLHLFTCRSCQNYVKQIKFMSEAFHSQEKMFAEAELQQQPSDAPRLSFDARERMKTALKAAARE